MDDGSVVFVSCPVDGVDRKSWRREVQAPSQVFALVIQLILAAFLLSGCAPPKPAVPATAAQISAATSPATHQPTLTSTSIPPSPTPTSHRSFLQLTYTQERTCETCLYGIASSLYAIEVGCLNEAAPCLGESQLLFEWEKWITGVDWSPDGQSLVFESEGKLYISDWNGANVVQIPSKSGRGDSPHWSPEGSQIAFMFNPARPGSAALDPPIIQIYDIAAGRITTFLEGFYDPQSIDWLTNGEMAVSTKVSESDWTEVIKIVDADGTAIRQLPAKAAENVRILGFTFSPDLLQFAFAGEIQPPTGTSILDIYVSDLNGYVVINLTNGLGYNLDPAWSPLGEWIAFTCNPTGNWNIYLIRPDGSQVQRVTQSPADEGYLAWRLVP